MQHLMSIVARSLDFTARERTKTGQPLVLSELERLYLLQHSPDATYLPWVTSQAAYAGSCKGWRCVRECIVGNADWKLLLKDVPAKAGLAVFQTSALWWRVGVFERTGVDLQPLTEALTGLKAQMVERKADGTVGDDNPPASRRPRTGHDVFRPMDLGTDDTFADRRRTCDQVYDKLRRMVSQLEVDYGCDRNPSWAISSDLFACWVEVCQALTAYKRAHHD